MLKKSFYFTIASVTCKLKKSHHTVKHIYFLPTLNANAQKNKRACPSPPPPKNNLKFTSQIE